MCSSCATPQKSPYLSIIENNPKAIIYATIPTGHMNFKALHEEVDGEKPLKEKFAPFDTNILIIANELGLRKYYDKVSINAQLTPALIAQTGKTREELHINTPYIPWTNTTTNYKTREQRRNHPFKKKLEERATQELKMESLRQTIYSNRQKENKNDQPHEPNKNANRNTINEYYKDLTYIDLNTMKEEKYTQLIEDANENILAYYTDGSYSEMTRKAGAGIYFKNNNTGKSYTFVGPQNAQRGELIGLRECLREIKRQLKHDVPNHTTYQNTTIKIYTDSLSSLYQILRWCTNPNSMKYHIHKPIVKEIMDLANEINLNIHFAKVESHTGIRGNEKADEYATRATHPSHNENEQPIPNETIHLTDTLEALPGGWGIEANPTNWNAKDECKHHEWSKSPSGWLIIRGEHEIDIISEWHHVRKAMEGKSPRAKYLMEYGREKDVKGKWPDIMAGAKVWDWATDKELTLWLKCLYGKFWTTNSPGHPEYNKETPNLCKACHTGPAGRAHMSLGCKHKTVNGCITNRHNEVCRCIVNFAWKGKYGGTNIRTDAGRTGPYPTKQEDQWTLHRNLLPQLKAHEVNIGWDYTLNKFPDIVMYHDVKKNEEINEEAHKITMIEVGYGDEIHLQEKLTTKSNYLKNIKKDLEEAGHSIEEKVIAIGARVPTTKQDWPTLKLLGIPKEDIIKVHKRIWKITIRSLFQIARAWRIAEQENDQT